MNLVCPHCFSDLGKRINTYGTVCYKCGIFIQAETVSSIYRETQILLDKQQQQIRQFLRKKTLGDSNGNQIK